MSSEKDSEVSSKIPNLALPFTLYDFFGYLLPGVIFWMTLLLSFDATHFAYGLFSHSKPLWDAAQQLKVFKAVGSVLKESPWFVTVSALLVSYITGHLISALSSYFGERLFVEKFLGYPGKNLFLSEKSKGFFSWLFSKFVRPYSPGFVRQFETQFQRRFQVEAPDPSDCFWLSFEYIAFHCPAAFARTMHFLNLYGFARNMSCSLSVAGVVAAVSLCLREYPAPWLVPVLLILTSLPFYWNYLKLLRRLNDEVFRAFVFHSVNQ